MAFQYEIRITTSNTVTDDDTYIEYIEEQVDMDIMTALNTFVVDALDTFPIYSRTYESGEALAVHGFDTLVEAETKLAEIKELLATTSLSVAYSDITEV